MRMLRITWVVMLLAVAYAASAEVERTPHVTAELVSEKIVIAPGETITAGLRLQMIEGWHTYWRYAGDSGEATSIDWVLPDGWKAGEIQWPHPQRIAMPPLTTYGYLGEVLLPVAITAPADAKAGTTARLDANVFWMVCHEVCIPEEVKLSLELPVSATSRPVDPRNAELFRSTRERIPVRDAAWRASAVKTGKGWTLRVEPPGGTAAGLKSDSPRTEVRPPFESLQFFASEGPVIEHSAAQKAVVRDGVISIDLIRNPYLSGEPKQLRGIVVANAALHSSGARAIEIDAPIGDALAATATSPEEPRNRGTEELPGGREDPLTVWLALGLAFVGGVILNLMPCVFPVVSLKVLGFVESARHETRRVRLHGLSFAAGVLVAFWILAGLLLVLRAVGEEIGWGFQLQSPPFVAAMAFLIFAIALVLAGVMEFGTSLTRLGNAETRGGYASSAMNGALATVVATPCTAPFMGAALGFAMTQSAFISLLIFTALGAGMAMPYVALSMWPALLRFLPRPGAWMERFKQAMAFPLFATAAWLVWVFGIQTGVDGVLRLLIGLTLVGLAMWIAGQWATVASATPTRWIARAISALVIVAALVVAMQARPVGAAPAAETNGGIAWEPFTPARVAELRASGKPVFIDFTAAWCLSCKVNERVAFSSREVQELVRKRGIVMVKADWTSRSPEITRALAGFGRSGVPLYVLYGSDPAGTPRLLPEVLTPGILLEAFGDVR